MLTLRESASLLGAASTAGDLEAIARATGFSPSAQLDAVALASLGLDDADVSSVRIGRGPGSLRALLYQSTGAANRSDLIRVASRVATAAPHVLWLLIAIDAPATRVLVGAIQPARRGVKVAALVVDRARVMDSDAETLRLLVAAASSDDLATYSRFVEILGRDSLSRRFFRQLEACVTDLAESTTAGTTASRREIALLYTSRLLFLGFLESKGWLDGDAAFLTHAFDDCMAGGGRFHDRVMLPLFFGTLNTPRRSRAPRARAFGRVPFLNGGLFTPTVVERGARRLRFSDEACGRFFGDLLSRYRFTAREETSSFEEAAIDPEMLGRTFECLMAPDTRRASGAFYTPHELVERVTTCGLEASMASLLGQAAADRLGDGRELDPGDSANALDALGSMRVLDPACGSGAFLVHLLERLAAMRALAGDRRTGEEIRREVLARSVFGIDVNPTAVWLCQLRLWLSIVIESADPTGSGVPPLPNLDRNIRVGDSLSGAGFGEAVPAGGGALRKLRERYTRSSGTRKAGLARMLDREERRLLMESFTSELRSVSAARREALTVRRGRDLFGGRHVATRDEARHADSLRARSTALRRLIRNARSGASLPFAFPAHFADVAASGGFSLVVGNPPWVRPHNVDARMRELLRRSFVVSRAAPWAAGSDGATAVRGFASQPDLAAIFAERSLRLLAPHGAMSLLLPSKLWRSLSGGGLRDLIATEAGVVRIEDYSDVPATFDAAVYPGLLVASRDRAVCADETEVAVLHRSRLAAAWRSPRGSLGWDSSPGAPWLLVPPEVRRAFDLLREHGRPMAESLFGRPLLGVKSGLNDAFLVQLAGEANGDALIRAANGRTGTVERECLRPVMRGEQVRAWTKLSERDRIVWTHGRDGGPMPVLPQGVARWLAPHRRALAARTDARQASRWWSVFRVEGAADDRPRVVWADIGRTPRATVLAARDNTVPLNSCYVARAPEYADALALAALLNSPLAAAWLSIVAEPARGGYRRYLGWTMSLFPIPTRWGECREMLSDIATRALDGPSSVGEMELLDAAIAAYGIGRSDIDPLLAWAAP